MSDYIDREIESAAERTSAYVVLCTILDNSLYHLSRIADSLETIEQLMLKRESGEGGAK